MTPLPVDDMERKQVILEFTSKDDELVSQDTPAFSWPPLVLADEPTGNLDTASAEEVFALLRSFNRDFGTTFLVVTHDHRLAARCDRVLELVDGRLTGEKKGSELAPVC